MAVSSFERASEVSRGVSGHSDERELPYIVKLNAYEDAPDNVILDYVQANTGTGPGQIPATWDGMPRRKINIEQLGPYWFVVKVRYSYKGSEPEREEDGVDKIVRQYRASVTNQRVRIAKAQDSFPPASAIDHGTDINVVKRKDSLVVEGADSTVPVQEFSLAYTQLSTIYDAAYIAARVPLVNKVNNATYLGFAKGEVKFLGLSGSVEDTAPDVPTTTFNFNFAYQPNVASGEVIAGVTITRAIEGWEKVWVDYDDDVDAVNKGMRKVAKGVYVYRDFEYGDFSILPS